MSEQEKLKHDDAVENSEEYGILSEEEAQRITAQFDKEANTRHYSGVPKEIMRWACIAFTFYMLIVNTVVLLPPQVHRASFVGLVVLYTFLLYPAGKKNNINVNYIPWYDVALALTGIGCYFYYVFNFRTIVGQMATFTQTDLTVAVIGIIVLFIACYRVVGLPLMVVVTMFLAYAYFGNYIPGMFGHAGVRFERIATYLFYTTEGVIGIPTAVASTFIFVFLLFGAFLEKTGIGQFFIDLSNAIAGRATGGPAKVAVIVSALEGTVSGSSVANTVASGSFTIPMMKRMGYDKNFAGAVEAAASTGGQIVPPIMGAAAFVMAEITGIPYARIALGALIPSLLYFVGVFAAVHFEAKRKGLRGMPSDEIPSFFRLLFTKGQLMLGIVAIIVFLSMGFTPTRAALYSILVSIAVSMLRDDTRLSPRKILDAMETGARNAIGVGVACAMAGMIVGVVTMTGLGITFANAMLSFGRGIGDETLRLIIVLILCMLASLILGLGVPTTAKYVIMATVTAPIMTQLGIPLLAAHMFVFYYGVVADITPPVGLASYAGAAVSHGSPMKTSIIASRLAIAAFIVPFVFVFNPQMLFIDAHLLEVVRITITGVFGIAGIAAGLAGFIERKMHWYERIFAFFGGLLMVDSGMMSDVIGATLIFGVFFLQRFPKKTIQ